MHLSFCPPYFLYYDERTCLCKEGTIHNKMNTLEEHIINAIKDIRSNSKRPDVASIFKYISSKNTSNYTVSDIKKVLDHLKNRDKVENTPTKKRYGLVFCSIRSTMCRE